MPEDPCEPLRQAVQTLENHEMTQQGNVASASQAKSDACLILTMQIGLLADIQAQLAAARQALEDCLNPPGP